MSLNDKVEYDAKGRMEKLELEWKAWDHNILVEAFALIL